ncbi:hypothetical protein Tco_1580857, partial [Tanacetum coccineum]
MKLKWEGEAISLTPPMLAIAAAVAGSPAEAHSVPHPPPFSPVREATPKRQPETEWVVPNLVSPSTDWRPWPSVLAPRPPTPPAQTLSLEEPLVFGPVPKPAGSVIQTIQDGLRESYECLASAPILEDSAVHRDNAGSFDAAVLSLVYAACCPAAGYLVYCCCLPCSCCSSILLPQEDLSRNLEL